MDKSNGLNAANFLANSVLSLASRKKHLSWIQFLEAFACKSAKAEQSRAHCTEICTNTACLLTRAASTLISALVTSHVYVWTYSSQICEHLQTLQEIDPWFPLIPLLLMEETFENCLCFRPHGSLHEPHSPLGFEGEGNVGRL